VAQAWYRKYFTEPYGEIYAEYLLPPEVAREEAQFACDALGLKPGERVLDCPCGYGRHMDVLRRLFPDISGLDLDRDCLLRALEYNPDLRVMRGDMRDMPFRSESFDAALNLFNSFGYFSDLENEMVLSEFSRVLRPGGGLLIDVANPDPLIDIISEQPRTQQQVHDLLLTEDWEFDPSTRLLRNRTEIRLGGKTARRGYTLRVFTLSELGGMLEKAGLALEKAWGDFDGEEYDPEESTRLIVAARKPSA
jgi:SAM-dependent methyltransferase